MTWAEASNGDRAASHSGIPLPPIQLVDPARRAKLLSKARADGLLVAEFATPGPALRGRLALLIEGAIEAALERRGAAPPGIGASNDLDASLSDQLYRARAVGANGLALGIPCLEGLANLAGVLDSEDSAVLRWWLAATTERPIAIALDSRDRYLGVYGPPTALEVLLKPNGEKEALATRADPAPCPAPEVSASSAAMELSALPPPVSAPERVPVPDPNPEIEAPDADPEPEPSAAPEFFAALMSDPDPELVRVLTPPPLESLVTPVPDPVTAEPEPVPVPVPVVPEPAPAPKPAPDPARFAHCERLIAELEGARGPKPLGTIERMFTSAYLPLADAVAHGYDAPEAREVLESWASSFARSYTDAFEALKVRGKRPTMVVDAPDLAMRMGRLHGARSVQLLLVDAMRFDLGLLIEERIRAGVGQRAALTERLLLWSALPTTTTVQLALIGRGPDGLREIDSAPEVEAPVARGRSASTLRRVKAGHRDLLKLDVIEARLDAPGPPVADRLDELAEEAAEPLVQHLLRLPPRTLVLIFGDHGFAFDPLDGGTSSGRQGGALPEEVLVPAFAWLVGNVH